MQKLGFEMRNICVVWFLSLYALMALVLTCLYFFVFHAKYSTGDITIDTSHEFENDLLNKLNRIRVMHSVPPLILDDELTLAASDWAIHIHKKAKKDGVLRSRFFHPINKGVCVYIKANSTMPQNVTGHLHAAVVSWYCEIRRFNFSNKTYSDNTAQFTQLIWKDTERVGFSRVVNWVNGDVAIVARFAPVGNSLTFEEFGRNVYEPVLTECPIKRDIEPATTTQKIWTTTKGMPEPVLTTTEEPEPTTTPKLTTTKHPKIRKPRTKPPVNYKNLTAFPFDGDESEETGNGGSRQKTMHHVHSFSVSGHGKESKKT